MGKNSLELLDGQLTIRAEQATWFQELNDNDKEIIFNQIKLLQGQKLFVEKMENLEDELDDFRDTIEDQIIYADINSVYSRSFTAIYSTSRKYHRLERDGPFQTFNIDSPRTNL